MPGPNHIQADAHQIIEEFVDAYSENTQSVRRYIPVVKAPRDTIQALAVKYDTTAINLETANGSPVEITITKSANTVPVVDLSGKSPSIAIRYYESPDVVKTHTELLLEQFLQNENRLVVTALDNTTGVNDIAVDTTVNTQPADVYDVYSAVKRAIRNINQYVTSNMFMIIAEDSEEYLDKSTPELKTAYDLLERREIPVITHDGISDCAYLLPRTPNVAKLVQVNPLEIKLEQEPYDLAAVFGTEAVAFVVNQPKIIQKLDFRIE